MHRLLFVCAFLLTLAACDTMRQVDLPKIVSDTTAATVSVLDRDGNGVLDRSETRKVDTGDPALWVTGATAVAGLLASIFAQNKANAAAKKAEHVERETDEQWDVLSKLPASKG